MSKHTPGPWKAIIWENVANVVFAENGIGVARVIDDDDTHLIAAAPQMLEALEMADALIHRLLMGADYAQKECEEIRAAIRAAKGGV